MSIWIHKYAPKNLSDVKDQPVDRLKGFVENYKKGDKALLLWGPQGCGKTSSVYALANEGNYEIVELNASDLRNAEGINSLVGAAINQRSLFGQHKIILVDEVDGVAGTKDRGGLQALTALFAKSSFPIIMTANDPYDKKVSSIKKKSELLEFKTLSYASVIEQLKIVAEKEGIQTDEDTLSNLARSVGGDLRAGINDIQSFTVDKKLSKEDLELAYGRDHTEKIINALVRIFKSTNAEVARTAFNEVTEDIDQIFLWIDENLPKEYTKIEDLSEALTNIAIADKFRGRIRRWQYYRFYVYCYDLLSVGVALAKKEKYPTFNKYQPTKRLLKIWMANQKNFKKRAISAKIADKCHCSKKRAEQDILPYLKKYLNDDISEHLELEKEEIAWLKG